MIDDFINTLFRYRDIISLDYCHLLYVNLRDDLFNDCSGSDFVNLLNLKDTSHPITLKGDKRIYLVCLIDALEEKVTFKDFAVEWRNRMLEIFDIDERYYKSHRKDFYNDNSARERHVKFRDKLLKSIEVADSLKKRFNR